MQQFSKTSVFYVRLSVSFTRRLLLEEENLDGGGGGRGGKNE